MDILENYIEDKLGSNSDYRNLLYLYPKQSQAVHLKGLGVKREPICYKSLDRAPISRDRKSTE